MRSRSVTAEVLASQSVLAGLAVWCLVHVVVGAGPFVSTLATTATVLAWRAAHVVEPASPRALGPDEVPGSASLALRALFFVVTARHLLAAAFVDARTIALVVALSLAIATASRAKVPAWAWALAAATMGAVAALRAPLTATVAWSGAALTFALLPVAPLPGTLLRGAPGGSSRWPWVAAIAAAALAARGFTMLPVGLLASALTEPPAPGAGTRMPKVAVVIAALAWALALWNVKHHPVEETAAIRWLLS